MNQPIPYALPSSAGVYAITYVTSGRRYIGGSKSVRSRCRRHWLALSRGTHQNRELQNAWPALIFSLVELCSEEALAEREQWQDRKSVV